MSPQERPTEPLETLRIEPRSSVRLLDRVLPALFWATVGGVVVGGTMFGLQELGGSGPGPVGGDPQATVSPPPNLYFDEDAMLKVALQHMAQRSYQSALSAAELVLRAHPDNARARRLADQTSELLRASALYGGFLRAADKQDAETAAALYAELALDSPFRVNAWEPFMPVRNQYVNRHLNLASAAATGGDCELILQQVDELRRVMDSDRDPDLLQGQRMLARCRRINGSGSSATTEAASSAAAMAEAAAPPSDGREAVTEPAAEAGSAAPTVRTPQKDSGRVVTLRDPFARPGESRESIPAVEKPHKVVKKRPVAKPSEPTEPAGGTKSVEAAKPPPPPPVEKTLPSALRNPFGP